MACRSRLFLFHGTSLLASHAVSSSLPTSRCRRKSSHQVFRIFLSGLSSKRSDRHLCSQFSSVTKSFRLKTSFSSAVGCSHGWVHLLNIWRCLGVQLRCHIDTAGGSSHEPRAGLTPKPQVPASWSLSLQPRGRLLGTTPGRVHVGTIHPHPFVAGVQTHLLRPGFLGSCIHPADRPPFLPRNAAPGPADQERGHLFACHLPIPP